MGQLDGGRPAHRGEPHARTARYRAHALSPPAAAPAPLPAPAAVPRAAPPAVPAEAAAPSDWQVRHRKTIKKLRKEVARLRPLAAEDEQAAERLLRMQAKIEDVELQIEAGKKQQQAAKARVRARDQDGPTATPGKDGPDGPSQFDLRWMAMENMV